MVRAQAHADRRGPVSRPRELPKLVRSPSHSRSAARDQALRAIYLHLHGVSAEDLPAILRTGFPKSPRGVPGQYHTDQQPDAASARQESGDGAEAASH